jgi:hypothetical protein
VTHHFSKALGPEFLVENPQYITDPNWIDYEDFDRWLTDLNASHAPSVPTSPSLRLHNIINISHYTPPAAVIDLTEDEECISITDSIDVGQLQYLDDAPEYWTVPQAGKVLVAYVLDFSGPVCDERLVGESGKTLTIDGYIKKQASSCL